MKEPRWKIGDGYFEVLKNSGNIYTKEKFGDCRIHLEWPTPATFAANAVGQNRGNSGVFLPGARVADLDSYENETYADGQAAAVYGKYPPLFNVSRKPGSGRVTISRSSSRASNDKKKNDPTLHANRLSQRFLVQDKDVMNGGRHDGHDRPARPLHAGAVSQHLGAAVGGEEKK